MPRHKQQIVNTDERPNTQDPMKILSAERYDDEAAISIARSLTELAQQRPGPAGYVFGIPDESDTPQITEPKVNEKEETARKTRKPRRANPSEDEGKGGRRRKKQKLSEDEDGEEDEASKKARGRPRLDTKDETAADRRRTQIRMAQRAYRHRKETTISSLESQVEKLQSATEEMNNVFIGLYDFAAAQGILQREPEFAQHLQATTRRVLALARTASTEESSHDDDSSHPDESKLTNHDTNVDSDFMQQEVQSLSPAVQVNLTLSKPAWEDHVPNHDAYSLQRYYNQISIPDQRPLEQQINSQTSFYDENFNFDMSGVDLHQLRAEIPDMNASSQFNLGIGNDQSLINKPISFASFETSFGRRLHRTANERGFRLLTNPNTHPKTINRVFGFSLLFRTKEQIIAALKRTLERSSTKELLNNWQVPFVHLGGSGTYYPLAEEDLSSNLMPKLRTGRSMGPLTPVAMSVRDTHMIDDFRVSAEGFEGKYFDSNDVEGYLRGMGVDITPDTEYLTINLDMISLESLPVAPTPVSLGTESSNSASVTPKTPLSPSVLSAPNGDQIIPTQTFEEIMEEIQMSGSFTAGSGYLDPSAAVYQDVFSNWINARSPNLTNNNNNNDNDISKHSPTLNAFDLNGPILNAGSVQRTLNNGNSLDSSASSDAPRLVTLSVSTLVRNISNRGVCLGRSPGFRPRDVDWALRRTIGEAY